MELQRVEDLSTFLSEVVFAEDEIKLEDAEGGVSIENVSENNLSIVYKNIPVNSLDFLLFEVEVGLLSSPESSGFGLLLGWDGQFNENSMDNHLRILIDPMGKFRVDDFFDKKTEALGEEESQFINKGNAVNKIKVDKSQSDITFYINDNPVFTVQNIMLTGTGFGLILGPLSKIMISSLDFIIPEDAQSGAAEEQEQPAPEEPEPEPGPPQQEQIAPQVTEEEVRAYMQYQNSLERPKSKFKTFMIILLLVLWAVGLLKYRMPGYIHILLVIAILLIVIPRRRRRG